MTKKKTIERSDNIKVVFVEGDADEIIIDGLIQYYRSKDFKKQVKIINTHGFPEEKKMKQGLKRIKLTSKSPVTFDTVVCEYDTDVLEKGIKLRPEWDKVEKNLKDYYDVSHFCRIEAKTSIEDWLLDDLNGLLKALNLPLNTLPKGHDGQEKVKGLFRKKNIVYDRNKGREKIKPYLDKLDIAKIRNARKKELKEFEKLLGVKNLDKKK
ncbi:MAG: hypothetical protein IKS65_06875 [Bacteroidales bacterium]|nr:hypothetical protein [Bacteroidales bacterium]